MEEKNKMDKNELVIDGKTYVLKGSNAPAKPKGKLPYVIVRTYSAGVFAGYLQKRTGKEATVINARRLWSWEGAASLSQLSMEGVSLPDKCKFPCEVDKVELTEVIEVLPCREKARLSIAGVPIWQK